MTPVHHAQNSADSFIPKILENNQNVGNNKSDVDMLDVEQLADSNIEMEEKIPIPLHVISKPKTTKLTQNKENRLSFKSSNEENSAFGSSLYSKKYEKQDISKTALPVGTIKTARAPQKKHLEPVFINPVPPFSSAAVTPILKPIFSAHSVTNTNNVTTRRVNRYPKSSIYKGATQQSSLHSLSDTKDTLGLLFPSESAPISSRSHYQPKIPALNSSRIPILSSKPRSQLNSSRHLDFEHSSNLNSLITTRTYLRPNPERGLAHDYPGLHSNSNYNSISGNLVSSTQRLETYGDKNYNTSSYTTFGKVHDTNRNYTNTSLLLKRKYEDYSKPIEQPKRIESLIRKKIDTVSLARPTNAFMKKLSMQNENDDRYLKKDILNLSSCFNRDSKGNRYSKSNHSFDADIYQPFNEPLSGRKPGPSFVQMASKREEERLKVILENEKVQAGGLYQKRRDMEIENLV